MPSNFSGLRYYLASIETVIFHFVRTRQTERYVGFCVVECVAYGGRIYPFPGEKKRTISDLTEIEY